MNRIAKTAAAAVLLGVGLPFAALTPAMADDGYQRADRHELVYDDQYLAGKACFHDRTHEGSLAHKEDPDVAVTECVVEPRGEQWVGYYYIIWSN